VDDIKTIVQRNFNRLVDSSNLTKREIAQQMKVSEATLQRWKSGVSFPELPNIERLALVLGVDAIEFYRTEEAPIKTMPMSEMLKRLGAIPNEIYELAPRVSPDNEVWKIVEGFLMDAAHEEELHAYRKGASKD
jgi:transcriptional regulator with XRE-family HTH domain